MSLDILYAITLLFHQPSPWASKTAKPPRFPGAPGIGSRVGIALAFVLVADMFPTAERVKWQSLFGVVYGSIPQELVGCT